MRASRKWPAAGIHLIVATQTPRADVITAFLANAFQVASKIDTQVILGENRADRLFGQGDMLFSHRAFHVPFGQGVLVTDDEIRRLVEFVSAQSPPAFGTAMHEKAPISGGTVFHFLKPDSA